MRIAVNRLSIISRSRGDQIILPAPLKHKALRCLCEYSICCSMKDGLSESKGDIHAKEKKGRFQLTWPLLLFKLLLCDDLEIILHGAVEGIDLFTGRERGVQLFLLAVRGGFMLKKKKGRFQLTWPLLLLLCDDLEIILHGAVEGIDLFTGRERVVQLFLLAVRGGLKLFGMRIKISQPTACNK